MTGSGDPVVLVGAGARTALGLCIAASAAAVRAGISVIEDHPFLIDRFGAPMKVARDALLPAEMPAPGRMTELATHAAAQALASLDGAAYTLLLATPEPRPGLAAGRDDDIAQAVADRLPHPPRRHGAMDGGSAAGLIALAQAQALLARGEAEFVLVCGTESWLDPDTMEWLDETEQLHSEGNKYGFCPGEAAGAVLLCRHSTARAAGLDPVLRILSVGQASEENLIRTESVCIGLGLGAAINAAFAPLPETVPDVDAILCDMNGERYRADEYGFAVLRSPRRFRDAADTTTPAACWGDVGAAGGPLHAGLAMEAARRGYASGPVSMLWASSMGGARAAAILGAARGIG